MSEDKRPATLLVIEPDAGGHRMRYVARILRGAAERGIEAILVTNAEGADHPYLEPFRDRIRAETFPRPRALKSVALAQHQFTARRVYARYARKYPSDRVLVPWGEDVDEAFSILAPSGNGWELLLARLFFHHKPMDVISAGGGRGEALRERLFRRLLTRRRVRRVLVLDELVPVYAERQGWRGRDKIRFVPEPADVLPLRDRAEARARLGVPTSGPVLLAYGAISSRKALPDAITAITADPGGRSTLLVVGRMDDGSRALLQEEPAQRLRGEGRLVALDRYVDEATEADAFAAADVLWLGYRDFYGPSAILAQAAGADRPVVACAEGLIGWRTRHRGLGAVLEGREPSAVLAAFNEALRQANDPAAAERRRAFAQETTPEAFVEAILAP